MPYKPTLSQVIDSTMMVTWRSCSMRHYYNFGLSLRPPSKSPDLVAGGALAAGCEGTRRGVFEKALDLPDALAQGYEAFCAEWGTYEPPEGHQKSHVRTWGALEHYFAHFPPLTDVVQPLILPTGKPAIEFTFAIPLEPAISLDEMRGRDLGQKLKEWPLHPDTNEPFILAGRFDMLATMQGMTVIVDEKTTKAIGPKWANQWELRNQFMTYCWACQHLGHDVHRAVVRGIAIQKTQYKLATGLPEFAPHILERWERQFRRDLWRMATAYRTGEFDFDFGDTCSSYGGCNYMSLCIALNPEKWMADYIIKPWDPLHKNPQKEEAKDD